MKRLVEETFSITAKKAGKALPKAMEEGMIELEIAGRYTQQIEIVSTASNLEGFVRWFICPGCQSRVGKLYLPVGEAVFLCRNCHGLAYRVQQLRAFKKPEKAKDKPPKKESTQEDFIREARAYLKKVGWKPKAGLSGF